MFSQFRTHIVAEWPSDFVPYTEMFALLRNSEFALATECSGLKWSIEKGHTKLVLNSGHRVSSVGLWVLTEPNAAGSIHQYMPVVRALIVTCNHSACSGQ